MTDQLTFPVQKLSCAACAGRAERALAAVPGVRRAAVNPVTGLAEVEPGGATAAALSAALAEAGYPAATREGEFAVEGLSCASCVRRLETALSGVDGVVEARVNLATEKAQVTWLDGPGGEAALKRAARDAGYPIRPVAEGQAAHGPRSGDTLSRDVVLSAALAVPVVILEMGAHWSMTLHGLIHGTIGQTGSWLIQAVLTTLILAIPGRRFFATGIPALLKGAPEMNALVAMGTAAAWGYSMLVLVAPGLFPDAARAVYFEAAAVICTLILVGRFLEHRAKGRAGEAIARLVALRPDTAQVVQDGEVTEMAVADLVEGDLVRLRPGDRIPVDGTVATGEAHVDESAITGEPLPVRKVAEDGLTGGTILQSGSVDMRVTAVGEATVLSSIIRMVEHAQGAKLPVQSLVDRITAVFVPAIIAIAVLTFAVWMLVGPEPRVSHALVAAISVLIVACPCAMGLATPVSIVAGTGRAAELGVLFRKGEALQSLAGVRVAAFDKTGTLTIGRPDLLEFHASGDADDALRLIAAAEARSEHPLATAVLRAAEEQGLSLPEAESFASVAGGGIRATVEGREVLVGSERFLRDEGVAGLDGLPRPAGAGLSTVLAAIDGQAAAVMGFADRIRPEARAAVTALQADGIEVALLTGDGEPAGRAVAAELGIDIVRAGLRPEDKVAELKTLGQRGPVLFVGDGINDAPALAAADVGLAIGTGTDVAVETADVVLMSGDPRGVARAAALSRATMRNIRQNLFWAFAYNTALIPVAAGVLYPVAGLLLSPALASGAMALSSVFVVTNGLRLRRFGRVAVAGDRPVGAPVSQEVAA